MMSKLLIALYVLTTSAALVVLKLGTGTEQPNYLAGKVPFNINGFTLAGIVLYGASFLTYIYLVSKYDLGYIIPLVAAFVYIIIFSASFVLFKETFTVTKIVGISLIVAGLVFLNLKS